MGRYLQRFSERHLASLTLTTVLMGAGCAEAPPASRDALRQMFPERAAEVLESGSGFALGSTGFEAIPQRGGAWTSGEIAVTLPIAGSEAIRLALGGGREVRVREEGVEGEGEIVGRAVAYRRPGGASFWSATRGGAEEWLLFDAGHARGDAPAAAWEIEGGTPRQAGDAVEIVDEEGVARLRVSAPAAYAEGGSPIEARLEARGSRIELRVDAGGKVALVDPVWAPTMSMSVARSRHTATRLNDGRVLVAGGINGSNYLASAELFDPQTDTWVAAGTMSGPRGQHTATLLQDGRVLVVGGHGNDWLSTAELYDPATNTWAPAGSLATARYWHTATLLKDGRVLVVAGDGRSDVKLDSVEIYTPEPGGPGSWALAAPIPPGPGSAPAARSMHTATLLKDKDAEDRVLIAGGYNVNGQKTSVLYNPKTDEWTYTGNLTSVRYLHAATRLPNGDVLVVGYNGKPERYHPDTGAWTEVDQLPYFSEIEGPIAVQLASGFVLVAGGRHTDKQPDEAAALFDPVTNHWDLTGSMNRPRYAHTATVLLEDGRVLVTGGTPDTDTAELYVPAANGMTCMSAGECRSGFCVDGVCCDSACDAGQCDACSSAAGASADGVCTPLDGSTCGNACTQTGICQGDVCIGADPIGCPVPDECHTLGVCDPATGVCSEPVKPVGTPCDGGICVHGGCILDSDLGPAPPPSSSGSGADPDDPSDEDSGCSCVVAPGAPRGASPLWPAWSAIALGFRRAISRGARPRRCGLSASPD